MMFRFSLFPLLHAQQKEKKETKGMRHVSFYFSGPDDEQFKQTNFQYYLRCNMAKPPPGQHAGLSVNGAIFSEDDSC